MSKFEITRDQTANGRFKRGYSAIFAVAVTMAAALHFMLFGLFPGVPLP